MHRKKKAARYCSSFLVVFERGTRASQAPQCSILLYLLLPLLLFIGKIETGWKEDEEEGREGERREKEVEERKWEGKTRSEGRGSLCFFYLSCLMYIWVGVVVYVGGCGRR